MSLLMCPAWRRYGRRLGRVDGGFLELDGGQVLFLPVPPLLGVIPSNPLRFGFRRQRRRRCFSPLQVLTLGDRALRERIRKRRPQRDSFTPGGGGQKRCLPWSAKNSAPQGHFPMCTLPIRCESCQ